MKSPFTGKEMKRIHESRIWKFRGEEYRYILLGCVRTAESNSRTTRAI